MLFQSHTHIHTYTPMYHLVLGQNWSYVMYMESLSKRSSAKESA